MRVQRARSEINEMANSLAKQLLLGNVKKANQAKSSATVTALGSQIHFDTQTAENAIVNFSRRSNERISTVHTNEMPPKKATAD